MFFFHNEKQLALGNTLYIQTNSPIWWLLNTETS